MRLILLSALLTACLDTAPADTATTSQNLCTIQDQAEGNCPGQEGCTPLDYCTDVNLQDGSCCIKYGHPATPTYGSVHCGDMPNDAPGHGGDPYCVGSYQYDLVIAVVTCVTWTFWVKDAAGVVHQESSTTCTLT